MHNERRRILLIEDNPGDARLINEFLSEDKSDNFGIEWVERLSDGLFRLTQNNISLVLLDLTLPDSDGFETFAKVHKVIPQKPIIVMTGMDDSILGIQMVESGAQDYLVKGSCGRHHFLRSVRYAIERNNIELKYKKAIADLRFALTNIKTLRGLFPICASCKNIKGDKGAWRQVEEYVLKHTEAKYSHGVCPNCFAELYPDMKSII